MIKEYINKLIVLFWPHRYFLLGCGIGSIFNFVLFKWEAALTGLGMAIAILIVVMILIRGNKNV